MSIRRFCRQRTAAATIGSSNREMRNQSPVFSHRSPNRRFASPFEARRLLFTLAWIWLATPAHSQTLDAFDPGADDVVRTTVLQPDGKILVGGNFTTLAGQTRNYLGRLNADGSADTNFDAAIGAQ